MIHLRNRWPGKRQWLGKEPRRMHAPRTGYGSLLTLASIVLVWNATTLSARADPLVCRWGDSSQRGPHDTVLDRHDKSSLSSPAYQPQSSTRTAGPQDE